MITFSKEAISINKSILIRTIIIFMLVVGAYCFLKLEAESFKNQMNSNLESYTNKIKELFEDVRLRNEEIANDISQYLGKGVSHKFISVDGRYVVEDNSGSFYVANYREGKVISVTEITTKEFTDLKLSRAAYDSYHRSHINSTPSFFPIPILIPR